MKNDIQSTAQTPQGLGMTEVETRQLAEVKGKMQLAKYFPRDTDLSLDRILAECSKNVKLAGAAVYSFPRGDSEVTGPSIRLVEVLAQHWGNLSFGVTELEQRNGESTVKAFAWDLETNVADEKVFTVAHIRQTRSGNYKLTDPRDIYELVANQGARRKRACILALIPTYVVDAAVEACEKTLEQSLSGVSIEQRRDAMATKFAEIDERITPDVIALKVGKEFTKLGAKDIVKLSKLYAAITDGFVKAGVAFDFDLPASTEMDEETKEAVDKVFGKEDGDGGQ
jgi:hypothetical protein